MIINGGVSAMRRTLGNTERLDLSGGLIQCLLGVPAVNGVLGCPHAGGRCLGSASSPTCARRVPAPGS